MHINTKRKITQLIIPLLLVVAFVGGGTLGKSKVEDEVTCEQQGLRHINQEICTRSFVIQKHGYVQLKKKLETLIKSKVEANKVSETSIYFRDLDYGPTLGFNEYTTFAPASLLKVPLMMIYLGLAEENPEFLKKTLAYRLKDNATSPFEQVIVPERTLEEGHSYSLDELLERMITYSDNRAQSGLLSYLKKIDPDKDLMKHTLSDLGIIDPQSPLEESISTKAYASIFIQLYHSTFFQTKEISDKALQLLVDTVYLDGLKAGVPEDVKVANKFGERSTNIDDIVQLHDCGIVYYPGNPYLLCVMTRGDDIWELEKVIQEISKMFYEEVDSRKL